VRVPGGDIRLVVSGRTEGLKSHGAGATPCMKMDKNRRRSIFAETFDTQKPTWIFYISQLLRRMTGKHVDLSMRRDFRCSSQSSCPSSSKVSSPPLQRNGPNHQTGTLGLLNDGSKGFLDIVT